MSERLAFYVTLENERGARQSDVVYATSYTAAGNAAEARHRGYEALQVDRDPDRDEHPADVARDAEHLADNES